MDHAFNIIDDATLSLRPTPGALLWFYLNLPPTTQPDLGPAQPPHFLMYYQKQLLSGFRLRKVDAQLNRRYMEISLFHSIKKLNNNNNKYNNTLKAIIS